MAACAAARFMLSATHCREMYSMGLPRSLGWKEARGAVSVFGVVEGLDQVGGGRDLAALARFVPGRVGLDHYDRSGIQAGPGIRASTDDFGGRIASSVRGALNKLPPLWTPSKAQATKRSCIKKLSQKAWGQAVLSERQSNGGLDSRLRGNDGWWNDGAWVGSERWATRFGFECLEGCRVLRRTGVWIPACAGMTIGGRTGGGEDG